MPISPKQPSKRLPSSPLLISANPEPDLDSESTSLRDDEAGETDQSISQSFTSGPSSPSRRRSRPSNSRRRSSSITAAADLMSSYSTQPTQRRGSRSTSNVSDHSSSTRNNSKGKAKMNADQNSVDDEDENRGLLSEYEEFLPHPSQNFRPRPYHIAIVSCLAALGNGIPLPTVFSLYDTVMCGVVGDNSQVSSSTFQVLLKQQKRQKGFWSILFPPSPELPQPANCPTSKVASLTSFYSSTLAVVGALLSLLLLHLLTSLTTQNSTSTLGFRFKKLGRKPPLVILHFFLSLTYLGCAIFPILLFPENPILTAVTLGISRVLADANNGSPLMLLTQNYVFDTTDEDHHASSLAFVDGFAQLGSFPSAAIGGWIAALTGSFWSPFYSATIVLAIASVYIMTCVPESRKGFREGLGKEEEEQEEGGEEEDEGNTSASNNPEALERKEDDPEGSANGGLEGHRSKAPRDAGSDPAIAPHAGPSKHRIRHCKYSPVRLLAFLSPLLLFLPVRLPSSTSTQSTASRRKHLRFLLLPPLLFLLSLLEACYNVFILPALLLFNTDILSFSVIQNGLIVSGLQAVRGVWLIAIWPRLLQWWRGRAPEEISDTELEHDPSAGEDVEVQRQDQKKPKRPNPMIRTSYGSTSFSPHTPLPDNRSFSHLQSKPKRSGDIVPLMFSYSQATLGFVILAASRSRIWSSALIPIVIGTWVLETGSGSHSCRTSLIVKLLGEIITEKREGELQKDQHQLSPHAGHSEQDQVTLKAGATRSKEHLKADLETSLLSSLQLLATLTLSTIPILTSAVYTWGLRMDLPETIWILKALCSIGSFILASLVWWVDGW